MSLWTSIRDFGESAASVAGNYLLPGSGFITSNLVSSGAQDQLHSPLGQLAMLGSGLTGGGFGEGTTGIPSASNLGYGWGNAFGALGFGSGAINAPEAGFSSTGGLGMSEQDIARQLGDTTVGYENLASPQGAPQFGSPWSRLMSSMGFGGAPTTGAAGTAGAGAGGGGGLLGGIPGPLRTALGGMQLLGGIQQYQAGRGQMARQEDMARQLAALEANPSLAMSSPQGILAARAAARSAAPLGGNPALAGAEAAGNIYSQRARELASLGGGTIPYSSPMAGLGNIGLGAYSLFA